MGWADIRGFLRDGLLALAVAFIAWFIWVQVMLPAPLGSGPAPDFALPELGGGQVALADHAEGVVVLNFWFTSCPPCRHEIPQLSDFHAAHPDVPLYGVSIDRMEPSRLAVVSEKLGVRYPVLHDRDARVARAFGVSAYPTTVVLRDGQIHAARMGEVTRASLERMVDAAR